MSRTVIPSTPQRRLRRGLRRVRRAVLARRRPIAAALAGLAVVTALQAHAAPPPALVPVLVAARDLSPGSTIRPADVERVGFTGASVPSGVLDAGSALGRVTVGPVRAGEPLTDARVLDAGLLSRYPGAVVAPVRVGDAASADLVRVGDRVTVLAADPQGSGPAEPVAEGVPVLAVPRAQGSDSYELSASSGALLVLALDSATAERVAGAAARAFLSVVVVR